VGDRRAALARASAGRSRNAASLCLTVHKVIVAGHGGVNGAYFRRYVLAHALRRCLYK